MSENDLLSGPDLDAAAAEQEAQENTNGEPKLPICPYCEHDPFQLKEFPLNNDSGVTLIVMSCADCRKVINVHIYKVAQRPMTAMPGGRIIRPQ